VGSPSGDADAADDGVVDAEGAVDGGPAEHPARSAADSATTVADTMNRRTRNPPGNDRLDYPKADHEIRGESMEKKIAVWVASMAVLASGLLASPAGATAPMSGPETCTAESTDAEGWTFTVCTYADGSTAPDSSVSQTWTVGMDHTINGLSGECDPSSGAKLVDHDYSGSRGVPLGVEVIDPANSIGTTGLIEVDNNGYAWGVDSLSLTNWWTSSSVEIILHCTTDSTKWYK
jgi:hypothetical protein